VERSRYVDLTGAEHALRITLGTARRLKESVQIDLLKAVSEPATLQQLLDRIGEDPAFVFEFLAIVEGVSAEALEAVADATVLEAASTAMVEAIVDFFPESSPLKGPIRNLMTQVELNQKASAALIEAALENAISEAFRSAESSSPMAMSGSGE
jgi:hypothetical protein